VSNFSSRFTETEIDTNPLNEEIYRDTAEPIEPAIGMTCGRELWDIKRKPLAFDLAGLGLSD
jgi:hypothetical protein